MKRFSLIPALRALLLIGTTCGKDSKNPTGPDPHDIQGINFVSIPGGTFQMGDVENAGA